MGVCWKLGAPERVYNKKKDALAWLEANSQWVHSTSEWRTA
jgi:hypothetical protein